MGKTEGEAKAAPKRRKAREEAPAPEATETPMDLSDESMGGL